MTHTPAPWSAFTDDSKASPHTNIVSVVPHTNCVFSLPGRHKNEADVKLIAAAPDLLAALQVVASKLRAGDDNPDDGFVDLDGKEVEQMFAALSRAT